MNIFRMRLLASTLMTGTVMIGAPAFAQDVPVATDIDANAPTTPEVRPAAAENADIVVTGSRITRPDLTASSPVAVVNAEAFRNTNAVTVESLLSQNPQFISAQTGASNNPGDGVATLDLRGLDAKRTLVLVDGKRLPLYDSQGAVDVNSIPPALIKRVDVLTGGASAVYGSDAVAGVVNFILDDRFTGLRFDGSSAVSERGDGAQQDVALTGGVKLGDRGNIVVSGGYAKRAGIRYADRPHNARTLLSSDLVSSGGSSNANPTVFDLANGNQVQVTPSGALTPDLTLYEFTPTNYAQLPFERYYGTALLRYDLTDGIEVFGRGSYSRTNVTITTAPTATAGYPFNIDPTNPFLTADERAVFFGPGAQINDGSDPSARAGTSTIGIRRRIVETPGRVETYNTDQYQAVGGLRGTFAGNLKWEAFAQYGEIRRRHMLGNDLSYNRVTQALDVVNGPNGPQCFDPSNGCVPLDVFTVRTLTPQELGFVLASGMEQTKTTQFVAGGNLSGDLGFLKSPFADKPAAFSIGAEYRRETAATTVDAAYASGDLIYYGPGQNIVGNYDVKEVFTELRIPIVQDRPGVKALNFEGGFRYSHYSTAGSVYTYKAGGDYAPVDGLRLRGLYQRAVRAPNINELFSPVVGATGSLSNDPCAGASVPAQIAAICLAQGAGSVGNIAKPVSGQINIFSGGNPNLKAEKSDTFTIGAVINPPSLRNFSLSVDYYKIKIGNAIDTTPPQITVNQCFLTDLNAASPACSSIIRNPLTGSLSGLPQYGVPSLQGNIAAIKTDGLDAVASYSGGRRDGFNYGVSVAGTYTFNYRKQASVQCAGRFGAACNIEPIAKWKHIATVSLGFAGVTSQTRWRYLGAVREDIGTNILKSRIPAYHYFDETLAVEVNRNFQFRVGMQNLLDTKSPIVGDTVGNDYAAGGTFPNVYDVIGRTVFAGVSATF